MHEAPILIADPSAFIQNLLGSIFVKMGLRSKAVSDVQSAVDLVAREPVAFVLIDALMPGVVAGQTIPYVQSLMKTPTPVIVMIPESDPSPAATVGYSQANGYLPKPFTENEIKAWLTANAMALLGREWQPPAITFDGGEEPEFLADPTQVETWIQALRSEDVTEAVDAAENLARHKVKSAVQPLIDCSYETQGAVKVAVVRALGRLGDRTATEALVANLNVPDQHLKEATLEALGHLQDPRALRPLSRLLNVHDKTMVLLAIKALGMLRCQEAKDILAPLLQSPDPQIKANVQWAIRVIDGMDV